MNYFKPDYIWNFYGILSREDYVEKNVILGNFHPSVPEEIVKSFETVTQLTVQAYYYYPLYVEALNKTLRIFEHAVKLKAIKLGITRDSRQKLIDKICENQNLNHLDETLNRVQKIRNRQNNPYNYSSGWFLTKGKGNIRMFANLINEIFLGESELILRRAERKKIEKFQKFVSKGPISIKGFEKEFFVEKIISFRLFSNTSNLKIAISLIPYSENIADRISNLNATPYSIILTEYTLVKNKIVGRTSEGYNVTIRTTKNKLAFKLQKAWLDKIEKLQNKRFENLYFSIVMERFICQCEDLIYNNSWEV